jgi:uncharacterized protein
VDQAGVLGDDLCAKVTAVLLRDEKSAADEIAVAVVPTTGGGGIEAWSTGLFNSWGVGKKGKNNGVLLVVARDDRAVRLETGRGVADRLSDGDAGNIVDDVTARCAEDECALGILTGLDAVRRQLGHTVPADALLAPLAATALGSPGAAAADGAGDPDFESGDSVVQAGGSESGPEDDGAMAVLPIVIGGFAVVLLLAALISRDSGRSRGVGPAWSAHQDPARGTMWSTGATDTTTISSFSSGSDSSANSGGGFGGGSSDGGGASGGW